MSIRFGPAGNSLSFYAEGYKSTLDMPQWLAAHGLNAFEYSCGRGVQLHQDTATEIGIRAKAYDIALSIHAPYFINLATPDPEKQEKTIGYIMASLKAARWMDAKRVIFHSGSRGSKDLSDQSALTAAQNLLEQIIKRYHDQNYDGIWLCPETMGRQSQLGTIEEIITLCRMDNALLPAIDFGHINALTQGALNDSAHYEHLLDQLAALGERGRIFHVHFSHIEYTKAGEKKHLTFEDTQFGPDFAHLAPLLAERRLEPVVICESDGTMAEDAKAMKAMYIDAGGMDF